MDDLISRQAAIDAINHICPVDTEYDCALLDRVDVRCVLSDLPSAQPERLTDDDFETIRIHLSAIKEKLCNQHRWKEAEEYQHIIDRFMAFASAQPERKKGKWIEREDPTISATCSCCGWDAILYETDVAGMPYCPNCGADMSEERNNAEIH